MAFNFSPPPFKQYIGTPYGVPISVCTPIDPKVGPKTVPITIDWSLYGASSNQDVAIAINLLQLGTPGQTLDRIRSVYIDNSFSPTPIYVFFPVTGFMVIAPPNSVVMSPVFDNDNQQLLIYANAFVDTEIPVTTIHVSNTPQNGYVLSTGTGSIVKNPSVVCSGNTNQPIVNGVTQTINNVPIGTADASRTVLLAINYYTNNGVRALSGVTINGNAATIIDQANASIGLSGLGIGTAIVSANIAAATTATVICTYSAALTAGATFMMNVDAFAAYNLTSPLVAYSHGAAAQNGAGLSVNLATTPPAGIAIASAQDGPNHIGTITGISNISSNTFNGVVFSRGYQTTTGAALNPSVTPIGGNAPLAIIAASFL